MRLQKHERPQSLLINFTPLIDIVFLLVIFFLALTQSVQVTRGHVAIPEVASAAPLESTRPTVILLDRKGSVTLDGERLSLVEFEHRWQPRDSGAIAARNITLRCDRDCSSTDVNRLMRVLARGEVKEIQTIVIESN